MSGIVIGEAEVAAITYRDQRVVTFAMVDQVHRRVKGSRTSSTLPTSHFGRTKFVPPEEVTGSPSSS